jgi:hypothetical protein
MGVAALLALPLPAAASFAAVVGPPRFELKATPGETLRQAIDIGNDALEFADYAVRTADWELAADGAVIYRDDLAPGSCRPWVRLERRELRMAPRQHRKFRFEVQVPPDAPQGECRFAIMIEGKEPSLPEGTIRVPMQGRIAVIAYVAVGDAKPRLEVRSLQLATVNGRPAPTVTLTNSGNAHGRPEGTLEARDAAGRAIEFSVSNAPVLAGTTRTLPLWPNPGPDGKTPAIEYPLRLRGTIEWPGGQHKVETVLRP